MTGQVAEQDPIDPVEPIDPDYPVTPVPRSARRSGFTLLVVLLGFTVFTPTMAAGAGLGPAFDFGALMGVIAIGSAILGTYVALMGYVGARSGLTTVVMARRSFGTSGSKLASIILGGTQVGWYGVTVGTVGDLTAQATGWESWWARAAIMLVTSALMVVTALYGYHGMYWASLVATPLVLILAVWVAFTSVGSVGGIDGLNAIEPVTTMSVATAVTAVVGTFVSAGTQVPNWTRFARSGSAAVTACLVAFVVGNGAMVVFGAIGALTQGEGDFVVVLFQLGLVGAGLFLLFGNLWTSNADTAYAFGVAGAELFNRPKKGPFVIGGAVIGTAPALLGVQNSLIDYLGLVGTFIPPLGGVIIADWFCRWRNGVPEGYVLPAFDWRNLAAFVAGTVVAYVTGQWELGIPPLFGILVAAGLVMALQLPRRTVRG
ncbi:cytosine permease [Naumannella halotolerans]|uniref:Cytosine permease n=1 Tax=Naumannella halotolerans TaxID=993414 RepID=A0A4R7JCE6_9ACTN|nr:cytosine permease [Naumannella halotolerans]TDT34377.1 cytosine permease [Naumannella halotolerans]